MNYLITYNHTQSGFTPNDIHNAITNMSNVTDWWHYLPNTYIVTTTNTAQQMANYLLSKFKGLSFLVIKIDPKDYNGVLNKGAWEWLRKKNNATLQFKPITQNPSSYNLPPRPPLLPSLANNINQQNTNTQKTLEDLLKLIKQNKNGV